eukprot:GHVS01091108.1.p1 GENE.GHVS01091108.1~~GHVS01091108.1.p1  ORF type:complete len:743 (-),score=69.93 GHVS01091108.1:214-2442(-)
MSARRRTSAGSSCSRRTSAASSPPQYFPSAPSLSSQSSSGAVNTIRVFFQLASPYFSGSLSAKLQLACVLLLSVLSSGLSVLFSYVGRDFWNALSKKDSNEFWRQLQRFMLLLVLAVPTVVVARYVRGRFSLQWRSWMTTRLMRDYINYKSFYEMETCKHIDNPDQRISEDLKSFTVVSLRFVLTVMSSIIDFFSFSFVLYSIAPSLFLAAFLYSGIGTWVTVLLGRSLVLLNLRNLQTEADFRYSLVRLRENAESVAFFGGEHLEEVTLRSRFQQVLSNMGELMRIERTLELFTSSYSYLIQILPAAVVAPQYFAGSIGLGVVSQAYGAFNHILSDMSIVVNQIEDLSAFAAGIGRLEQMVSTLARIHRNASDANRCNDDNLKQKRDLIDEGAADDGGGFNGDTGNESCSEIGVMAGHIQTVHRNDGGLHLSNVTVRTPDGARTLVYNLSLRLQGGQGERLLIVGSSGTGKSSLLRAIAGLWTNGGGVVERPPDADTFFFPQKPYCPEGTLRQQLLYPMFSVETESAEEAAPQVGAKGANCATARVKPDKQIGGSLLGSLRKWWMGDARIQPFCRDGSFLEARSGKRSCTSEPSISFKTSARFVSTAQKPVSYSDICDVRLLQLLEQVRLGKVVEALRPTESNPLDSVRDWSDMLSLGEQQRMAFGRLLLNPPRLAVLDEATSALDLDTEREMYRLLGQIEGMAYVSVGHRPSLVQFHHKQLELAGEDGYVLKEIHMNAES